MIAIHWNRYPSYGCGRLVLKRYCPSGSYAYIGKLSIMNSDAIINITLPCFPLSHAHSIGVTQNNKSVELQYFLLFLITYWKHRHYMHTSIYILLSNMCIHLFWGYSIVYRLCWLLWITTKNFWMGVIYQLITIATINYDNRMAVV